MRRSHAELSSSSAGYVTRHQTVPASGRGNARRPQGLAALPLKRAIAYSWAAFPFIMLLLLAGMQGIPKESYEAAKVDGANWWQLFRFITIPALRGGIIIALLLEIISALNSFDMLYVLTGGGPGNSSQILSLFIYQTGFTSFNLGGASALSMLLLVLAFALFVIYGMANHRTARQEVRG